MGSILLARSLCPLSETRVVHGMERSSSNLLGLTCKSTFGVVRMAQSQSESYSTTPPLNLRSPRRPKLPPESGNDGFLKKNPISEYSTSHTVLTQHGTPNSAVEICIVDTYDGTETDDDPGDDREGGGDDVAWEPDEIEAISSLFRGSIPQKPGKPNLEMPLPLPHKIRSLGYPSPKRKATSSRHSVSKRVYKNASFLVGLAKEIRSLRPEEEVSTVLSKWSPFLRKGSLSLTIRELGRMGLPKRALQSFCWAQKQPHLFPDDWILSSTVEVLARTHWLKIPSNFGTLTCVSSRSVIEAMVRGFIKGGNLEHARKLLLVAKNRNRMLDSSLYAKLILEFSRNPDMHFRVYPLLEDLGGRDDLNLNQQDCTAVMKVCTKVRKFEIVESLFNWFKQLGHDPGASMYTTVIHSRCSEKKYKEAMTVVWEMEASNCPFDLPAYRVVINLFVALNDLSRSVRYFSKLKEAGFSPTYDIYRNMFTIYVISGRVAECKEVCKEAEMAGFLLDKQMRSQLLQL